MNPKTTRPVKHGFLAIGLALAMSGGLAALPADTAGTSGGLASVATIDQASAWGFAIPWRWVHPYRHGLPDECSPIFANVFCGGEIA